MLNSVSCRLYADLELVIPTMSASNSMKTGKQAFAIIRLLENLPDFYGTAIGDLDVLGHSCRDFQTAAIQIPVIIVDNGVLRGERRAEE